MIWELNACFGALRLKVSPPSKPFARWLAVVWRQEKQQGEWLRAGEAFHGSASDLTHHVPEHVSPDLHPCRCTSMLRSTSTRSFANRVDDSGCWKPMVTKTRHWKIRQNMKAGATRSRPCRPYNLRSGGRMEIRGNGQMHGNGKSSLITCTETNCPALQLYLTLLSLVLQNYHRSDLKFLSPQHAKACGKCMPVLSAPVCVTTLSTWTSTTRSRGHPKKLFAEPHQK